MKMLSRGVFPGELPFCRMGACPLAVDGHFPASLAEGAYSSPAYLPAVFVGGLIKGLRVKLFFGKRVVGDLVLGHSVPKIQL